MLDQETFEIIERWANEDNGYEGLFYKIRVAELCEAYKELQEKYSDLEWMCELKDSCHG